MKYAYIVQYDFADATRYLGYKPGTDGKQYIITDDMDKAVGFIDSARATAARDSVSVLGDVVRITVALDNGEGV